MITKGVKRGVYRSEDGGEKGLKGGSVKVNKVGRWLDDNTSGFKSYESFCAKVQRCRW